MNTPQQREPDAFEITGEPIYYHCDWCDKPLVFPHPDCERKTRERTCVPCNVGHG